MKKYLIWIIIGVFAISMLFMSIGCKKETTPTEEIAVEEEEEAPAVEEEEEAPAEEIVLEMWKGPHSDHDQEIFAELIADFEADHPGVRIEYIVTPWETIAEQYTTTIAAGEGPDIFMAATGGLWDASVKLCYDYTDIFSEDELKELTEGIPEDLYKGNVSEGRLVGVCWHVGTDTFSYNETMLKDAGYDNPPTTWEELLEVSRAITKDTDNDGVIDQWGYAYQPMDVAGQRSEIFLYQAGFKGIADDGINIGYDDPRAIEAFKFLYKLYIEEKVAFPVEMFKGVSEWGAALDEGKFAMAHAGALQKFLTNYPDWENGVLKVGDTPAGPGKWLVDGMGAYGASSIWPVPEYVTGNRLELVKELILGYLYNPKYQIPILNEWHFVPANSKVTETMELDEFQKQIVETSKYAIPYTFNDHQNSISEILREAVYGIQIGQLTPEEAWKQAVERGKEEMLQ